jgi:hypothetical protein
MNGTTNGHPEVNGDDKVVGSLETWASNLLEAARAYKSASGQQSLRLRSQMTDAANQIINAVKEPEETPFEYSVQVRRIPKLSLDCFAYRR